MSLNASSLDQIQFRISDSEPTRVQKLEMLRTKAIEAADGARSKTLQMSITDGLADADPAEPLLRIRFRENTTLGAIVADAGDAATGTVEFRILKDGAANGVISFTGTDGSGSATDSFYPAGSLFELYPPLVADATLDDVSISIPLTVS